MGREMMIRSNVNARSSVERIMSHERGAEGGALRAGIGGHVGVAGVPPGRIDHGRVSFAYRAMSASTIIVTSSAKLTEAVHPSVSRAFDASPMR